MRSINRIKAMQTKPVYIIAEAGVNHNGSYDLALQLVDAAVECGADCIKFQMFRADKLVSRHAKLASYQDANTGSAHKTQYDMLKELELSDDEFRKLKDYCQDKNIDFLVTPFDHDSLAYLVEELGQTLIKIGSGDMDNAPLLLDAAQRGVSMIVSTGMSTSANVKETLDVLAYGYAHPDDKDLSKDKILSFNGKETARHILAEKISLLHCTTQYPTPLESVNLRAMYDFRDYFDGAVGFSDHTAGITVPVAAVAMGATIIEKHFTLDCNMQGPDHKASLAPAMLKQMVDDIRDISMALGSGEKRVDNVEELNVAVARKSIVAKCFIKKGERLTPENIVIKRPGNGIPPIQYWDLINRVANQDIEGDELIDAKFIA